MYDPLTAQPTIGFATLAPAQTQVAFTCMLFDLDDLVVTRDGVACTRVTVPLTNLQYSVTATLGEEGGTITFGVGAIGGEVVFFQRVLAADRQTNLSESGPLGIAALNEELTRATAVAQGLLERLGYLINQTVRVPLGENLLELPEAADRLGKVLGFDETTGAVTLYDGGDLVPAPSEAAIIDAYNFMKTNFVEGTNVDLVFADGPRTVTINITAAASYTTENMQDDLNTTFLVGAGLSKSYNDAGNSFTVSIDTANGTFVEAIQDLVAAFLTATSPLVETYNDAGNSEGFSIDQAALKPKESMIVPLNGIGDAPTTGVKYSCEFPYAVTLQQVLATLATAQTSGSIFTLDVLISGVSVFTTNKVTIDNGEKTSATALTAANLTTTAIPANTPVTFQITQVGVGGAGANAYLVFTRT